MGYDVPAALGLQAANGRRPLVLVGDGAFQMTGWELGNCRRYGWDPIVVVFNFDRRNHPARRGLADLGSFRGHPVAQAS